MNTDLGVSERSLDVVTSPQHAVELHLVLNPEDFLSRLHSAPRNVLELRPLIASQQGPCKSCCASCRSLLPQSLGPPLPLDFLKAATAAPSSRLMKQGRLAQLQAPASGYRLPSKLSPNKSRSPVSFCILKCRPLHAIVAIARAQAFEFRLVALVDHISGIVSKS